MKLTESRFIILDTETTDPEKQLLIEIAGLDWSYNKNITNNDFKESFVNPRCKIHPASQAVNHISNEDVSNAPFIEEIEDEWSDWINDSYIIAYNSDFDKEVVKQTPLYQKKWLDAYRMAMHFWSINDLNEDNFPLTSFKQQELRYWLKLPKTSGDAHRAAADIQVTAFIVKKVIENYLECGNPDSLKDFVNFINAPILHKVIPIGNNYFCGKEPEEVPDWALKKAFDKNYYLFDSFKKFNVHECLYPEYVSRFGHDPYSNTDNQRLSKQSIVQEKPKQIITPVSNNGIKGRWKRK